MIELYKQITRGQFEAALAMLKQCVESCPDDVWESRVAELTVRQIAYHTLFFVDVYLSTSEESFTLRELHHAGGDEREPISTLGLSREATLQYLAICLDKLRTTIAGESEEVLRGPSGFRRRTFSRAELHLYNLRHVQHHTGQISAHMRRAVPGCRDDQQLKWVSTGDSS